jgi:uncharacterized protein YndB with AHSA1/START domain
MPNDATPAPAPTADTALRSAPQRQPVADPGADANTPQGRSIVCEVRTTAPPEHAWAAWADPEKIAHWFVDRAYGDVRPGGVMTWVFDQFKLEIPYPVLEATAPSRLVLGGEIPGFPPFRLEITIARDKGETVVRLFNSGFREGAQWDEEYAGVASGWRLSLALLREYLERHYGTPKQSILVMQPAPFQLFEILPWFTEEARLAQWLTTSGGVGAPGSPAHLVMRNGEVLRGTVLDVTGQEAALSWDDANMALEFKAFAMGPSRVVGIRLTGWDADTSRMRSLETSFRDALARLAALLVP